MNRRIALIAMIMGSFALAKGRRSRDDDDTPAKKIPKVTPVDNSHFDNAELAPVPPPADPEEIPNVGQLNDSFAVHQESATERANYSRVPEAVREIREVARKQSIIKAQITLYDYIRATRLADNADQILAYEEVVKKHQRELADVMLLRGYDKEKSAVDALYKVDPFLKEAVTYYGIVRLYGIYGNFAAAPVEVRSAQKVEFGFHSFDPDSGLIHSLAKSAGIKADTLIFTADTPAKIQKARNDDTVAEIRRFGTELIWDMRAKLLPGVAKDIDAKIHEGYKTYVPYDRIYIDAFKSGAFYPGSKGEGASPEFLAIWRFNGAGKKYRKELLAIGLMTSGAQTESRFALTGQGKGEEGNSPDGIWRIFGFNMNYIGDHKWDMRGMTMLSYGNKADFVGRGFHLLLSGSNWGSCGSHGCFRVYTASGKRNGLANVIWAAINPGQLNEIDNIDFGSENMYSETPFIREMMRTIRERVWDTTYSKFDDGMSFSGPALYSTLIRRQYQNFETATGVSILYASKKLWKNEQKIIGPVETTKSRKGDDVVGFRVRRGQYWVYDTGIKNKAFEIDFRKSSEKDISRD